MHESELPASSIAVQVTRVAIPTGKTVPEGGLQERLGLPAKLSDAVGSVHDTGFEDTILSSGHVISGD